MSGLQYEFVNRRNFLKAAAAGCVFLPSADYPTFVWRRQETKTKIALIKTGDRKQGVSQILKLLDTSGINGKNVMIKPNFNSADTAPGSTHNDVLVQLVEEIRERGARDITLGESSGPGSTRRVMERKGIFDMANDMKFDIINYEEMPEDDWVHFPTLGAHWQDGFYIPRHAVNAEYLVSTCCLKTHGSGGVFSMSLKLSVGMTPKQVRGSNPRRTMHRSPDMRRMIAELNLGYKPRLIVLDGIDVFVDGGPSRGDHRKADVIIAGTDRVAVDAAGLAVLKELGSNSAIMNRKIFEQEQMARAVEIGIGIKSANEIEFVTPDEPSKAYASKLQEILTRE